MCITPADYTELSPRMQTFVEKSDVIEEEEKWNRNKPLKNIVKYCFDKQVWDLNKTNTSF